MVFSNSDDLILLMWSKTCSKMFLPRNLIDGWGFSGADPDFFFFWASKISREIAYYSSSSLNVSDSSIASIKVSPYLKLSAVLV